MSELDRPHGSARSDDVRGDPSHRHRSGVLVPVDGEGSAALFSIACDLVANRDGALVLAAPVIVPRQTPLDDTRLLREGEDLMARSVGVVRDVCGADATLYRTVRTGHRRTATIRDMVADFGVSMVLSEQPAWTGGTPTPDYSVFRSLPLGTHFDTAVAANLADLGEIGSVLVPVARGPHSGFAVELGSAIARRNDARLELFHVEGADEETPNASYRLLDAAVGLVGDGVAYDTTVVAADDVAETIVLYSGGFDLTILGAPREGILRQFVAGSIPDDVADRSSGAVLTAYKGGADRSWLDRLL